ncbi:hypothetical protein [Ornithinibacillus contaminans]|uniref:hypothetical protein n=1 Tax=Ornithinibacillus contaminans TaxID=694055 RepID=UPI00064DDD03|nr:hypothetical protein [Ornithinibacillus contaminans]
MLKTFGILLLFLIIGFMQVYRLAKEKLFREIWISMVLLTFAAILTILRIHDISIPNPLELIAISLDPFIKLF